MASSEGAEGSERAEGAEVRHAWLQKHPTPRAAGGEFHWYAEGAARDDEAALRGRVVEQVQGLTAPAVWWELSPDRVIWAAVFSAISPTDARPYRGVALTIAGGDGGLRARLAEMPLAPPEPWSAASAASAARAARSHEPSTLPSSEASELARALLSGGAASVEDPHDPRWPARLAELVHLLPAPLLQRTWRGQLSEATTTLGRRGERSGERSGERRDGVAELLAAAWISRGEPERRTRATWQLLVELAAQEQARAGLAFDERWLDETLARSEQAAARARSPEALWQWLDESERAGWSLHHAAPPASWPRLLHGWGRGWLDEPDEPGERDAPGERDGFFAARTQRFADELCLRALALLRAGGDASSILAEVRWHALLPAARRRAMLNEMARCAPSLRANATTNGGSSSPASSPISDAPTSNRSRQESADVA
jgi:hypothetical protein